MKKFAKFISCIALVSLSGSAFARPNTGSALDAVLANTDAQLASAMTGAMEPSLDIARPEPVAVCAAAAHNIRLQDITDKHTSQGEVVASFPAIYKMIHSEENSRIIKVFRFTDRKGAERLVEVYYTGGDWMQYGLTYIVTNAGPDKDQVNAYFVSELSTSDREEGAVAPAVNPFDAQKLPEFIASDFLDASGNVNAAFSSVASVASAGK